MARLGRDHLHPRFGHADILGGDVAATQRFDRAAERLQLRGSDSRARLARQDHALAAAERQIGHRILVAHAARQAQRVGDRGAGVGIVPETHPAGRRAELGRMDCDDCAQPRLAVAEQMDALMVVEIGEAPVGDHALHSCGRCRTSMCRARSLGEEMGRMTGLEPATLGTTNRCSNQLSYNRREEGALSRGRCEAQDNCGQLSA